MEQIAVTVHGENAGRLPSAINGVPRNKRVDYDGDGFAVIVTEQYHFKTNSSLQTTTIFELVDETTCEVTIVSGGGGAGLLQHDWGTESGDSNKLVAKLEAFCREHGLDIEHG
ncbi:hypothetical protein [Haloarcula onubensis]|uniref:Uncharacterized protein n=1 Tax=Haloarcula onubensis TaxID=2950539 RepID=A0ABU2FQ50_9EURY|nr:hypothetical protein [Halomicroarcula sp. S3CR25-11]MDS0282401.1 hypothetical protein [Halomicroarcula sp. S3CR25-11]